ncbi:MULTISPECIES: LacI family DNA-binding transcriptional regulator [Rahnella]|uniref:LacI family DNA-binding transcriptional regulator n=1 Tax=Rahnella sp. BIGb0236 TaxID=2485117 RepID=UPI001F3B32C7|nr:MULTISPECIES: LacI family DNA-binding transcriptional regulator [Rahnella]
MVLFKHQGVFTLSKITLKSIARELGVTHTTVSNAFNNPGKLSESLKKRIIDYAHSVNFYGPDNVGRALRTGKSNAIGIIFNDTLSYAFTDRHDVQLMQGIAAECDKEGVSLILIPLHNQQGPRVSAINTAVDGYILNATHNNDQIIAKALAKKVPVVTTDFRIPPHSSVSIDNRKAMHEICQHLLEKGHREFGIISFPSLQGSKGIKPLTDPVAGDNDVMLTRVNACVETFLAANIALNSCFLCETRHHEECGEMAARELLARNPAITALICLSDRFAQGAANYCRKAGLSVPQDIAITGFDNIPRTGNEIALTTISQDPVKKGEMAASLLLSGKSNIDYDLGFTLIIRGST